MRFRFLPREEKFYTDFLAMADQLTIGAKLLADLLATDPPVYDKAAEIKVIENKCDFLTHQVIQRLHRTFVTPIDREDIHELARSLDDVMDAIDASAALIPVYRIERVRWGARDLTRIIVDSTTQLRLALKGMEAGTDVNQFVVEINRLENEADRAHQEAVRRLFEEERDALHVIKWKEILDDLEGATDRIEDVSDVIQGVVVKHA